MDDHQIIPRRQMRLVAIYNVWDDYDLLKESVRNIENLVDGIIIVWSKFSNYGEQHCLEIETIDAKSAVWFNREPIPHFPMHAETDKRNFGLDKARELGFTHFITMDADEFYDPEQFHNAKLHAERTGVSGIVVESYVYFKSPTLTIGKDITLVPHIHKLTPTIKHEFNKQYPFAWSGKQIRIDPTRSYNINSGVEMFDCPMFHASWIRKDFDKKIRNSTARANLERSTIREDLANAKPGYFCKFYQKTLMLVDNKFNLPEF